MNKRIRKKQLKRVLNELITAYDEYLVAWERVFCKAQQDMEDACRDSKEAFYTAFQRYMGIASVMASSGPPPRF